MLTPVEMVLFLLAAIASLVVARRTFRHAAATINAAGSCTRRTCPAPVALEGAVSQRTVFKARADTGRCAFIVWDFCFTPWSMWATCWKATSTSVPRRRPARRAVPTAGRRAGRDGHRRHDLLPRAAFQRARPLHRDNVRLHERAVRHRQDSIIVRAFILTRRRAVPGRSFWVAQEWGDAWQPFAGVVASVWTRSACRARC